MKLRKMLIILGMIFVIVLAHSEENNGLVNKIDTVSINTTNTAGEAKVLSELDLLVKEFGEWTEMGINRYTGTEFNLKGYDMYGVDIEGYDKFNKYQGREEN